MHKIHPSIDCVTGESKFFNLHELNNFNFDADENVILIFLLIILNYSFDTPFHYLLSNNNFKLFNQLAKMIEIEINLKKINEFITCDKQIDKIIEMFIFILENKRSYPKKALEYSYCYLSFDGNYFGYHYDDNDDFNEDDSHQDDDYLMNQKR